MYNVRIHTYMPTCTYAPRHAHVYSVRTACMETLIV